VSSALPSHYLRIGELADRAGVSVATIKFYIREGLLPPPPVKTGRTMGYYDEAYLERLLLIRKLREEHFLPIRAIRLLLEERGDRPLEPEEQALIARIGPVVAEKLDPSAGAPRAPLDRASVLAKYDIPEDDLDVMVELGLVGGHESGHEFSAADLELLDALQKAEQVGLTRERFPVEGLGHYVELIGELARREVRRFSHLAGHVPQAELARMAELATQVTEPIVTLIRRKLILRALREQIDGKATEKDKENKP
jgi:DNA-binding transcriptional MerR regulator